MLMRSGGGEGFVIGQARDSRIIFQGREVVLDRRAGGQRLSDPRSASWAAFSSSNLDDNSKCFAGLSRGLPGKRGGE